MTDTSEASTGRTMARWAAMAVATYLLTGIVYAVGVFVSAGESPVSGSGFEVITSFILPAFYSNPARALTAPAIAVTALLVSAAAVVLATRAIQYVWTGRSTSAESHAPRDSR